MVVLLLALGGGVSSFAETPPFEPVTIQLRWSHQFQFAGYYAAVEKGFYKAEGLDVFLEPSLPGQDPVVPVLEGRAQYGVGEAGILKLRADGRPLVLLAQIFQHSPNILMTRRESNIYSPYELKGKNVRLNSGPAGSAAVRAMILETLGGLDQVTIIPRHYDGEEFTDGKADAVAGYLSNEPYRMKQAGLSINIIDPRSYGIDLYGDNLFTTEAEIAAHPERAAKVRRATLKGWAYALKNKEEIIDLILARYNSALDSEQLRFEAKVVDQMILADLIPIGDIYPQRYKRTAEIFHRLGMIPSPSVPEGFLYKQKPDPTVPLDPKERAWLEAHPDIRFSFSNDFQPLLIAHTDGHVSGILKDMLDLLNRRLGTDFGITVGDVDSWQEMIEKRQVAGSLAMTFEGADQLGLLHSRSYLRSYPTVFSWWDKSGAVQRLEDLAGSTCAIIGDPRTPFIKGVLAPVKERITIVRTGTLEEGMDLLFQRKVDYFVGYSQQNYHILANQLYGLGPVLTLKDYPLDVVMAVRKDWPQLVAILNKGLASISEAERSAVLTKWTAQPDVGSSPRVTLSLEERIWLRAHPDIRFVFSNDYQPALIAHEDGRVTGILKDMLDLLNARLGTDFGITVADLESARKMARNKNVSGWLAMSPAAAKLSGLTATTSHIKSYPVVFGRADGAVEVRDIEDLAGHRCAFEGGMPAIEALVAPYEERIAITRVKTAQSGLNLLFNGQVEFFIGFTQHNYIILNEQLIGLVPVLTMVDHPVDAVMGIRSDWPELVGILNKGLATISEVERNAILARWSGLPQTKSGPPQVALSPEEKAWLVQNPTIQVALEELPPFVIVGEGIRPTGMSVAYLDLIARRTGLQFRYEAEAQTLDEALEGMRHQRGPDLIPCLVRTPEGERNTLFTKEYMRSPNVIFSAQGSPLVTALEDLSGKVVGLTRGSALQEAVMRAQPDVNVRLFATERESLQAVEEGRADACIGNLSVGTYLILENGWSNLKVAAPSGLEDCALSFGVRKDWPELRRIIDKGLDSISPEERNAIRNQYLTVRYDHGIRKADIAKALLILGSVFGLVICAVVFWNVLLGRKVAERTADLDLANKRLWDEIVQRRNTEKALRASRDYLDNLTNSMADIVVSVKMPERTIEWVNDAIRTLGYEPQEIIGQTTEFIYAHQDDFIALGQEMDAAMGADREDIVTELMFQKKNGETFPAEITISFFEDKGELVSVTGIIRDISERKERERQIDAHQQRLKALASKLTMSEERERRRMATELHDHVGQSLAIARLQLASAKRSSSDTSSTLLLEEVSHTLLEAAQETRQLIFDLSTPAIKELGLQAALRDWLNERMPKHGIVAALMDHTDSAEALPLTDDEAALIFRHARELLTNVIKHAKANRVKVEVAVADNEIHIAVQDNGVGFEAAGAPGNGKDKGHFGLFSIKESMADLGGSLEIDAASGKGCRAVLRLPVIGKGSKVQG
jgi:two-component system sensor histidine kinase EvgS